MINIYIVCTVTFVALLLFFAVCACLRVSSDAHGKPKPTQENLNQDTCVCCGAVVPEGRMVCPNCEEKGENREESN